MSFRELVEGDRFDEAEGVECDANEDVSWLLERAVQQTTAVAQRESLLRLSAQRAALLSTGQSRCQSMLYCLALMDDAYDTSDATDESLAGLVTTLGGDRTLRDFLDRHFDTLLQQLRPFLACNDNSHAQSWHTHLWVVPAFKGVVTRLPRPHLHERVAWILPGLMRLLQDYREANKRDGIAICDHVVQHVDAAELRWNGHAEVLLQSLENQVYVHDAQVLHALAGPLVDLLASLEPWRLHAKITRTSVAEGGGTTTSTVLPSAVYVVETRREADSKGDGHKSDATMRKVMQSIAMNLKRDQATRTAYVHLLSSMVTLLGADTIRHLRVLLPLLCTLLVDTRTPDIVDLLRLVTAVCWPRIPAHTGQLMAALTAATSAPYTPVSADFAKAIELFKDHLRDIGCRLEDFVHKSPCK